MGVKRKRTRYHRVLDLLRAQLMAERGVMRSPRSNTLLPTKDRPTPKKTEEMLRLEDKYGEPIEYMLLALPHRVLRDELGLDSSTISQYKKELGLQWSINNLPSCKECRFVTERCLSGICEVLFKEKRKRYLIPAKSDLIKAGTSPHHKPPLDQS